MANQINSSTNGVNFDPASAKRIAKVVRDYERKAGKSALRPSATIAPTPRFWVQLTDEDPYNPGSYNWIKQDMVAGQFQDTSPVIQDNQNHTAQEANAQSGLIGQYVELLFYGYDGNENPVYLFNDKPSTSWFRIDCYCPLGPNQWSYSAVEQIRTAKGFENKPDGITLDCCDGTGVYAINSVEANNTSSGLQGNSIDLSLTPPYGNGTQYLIPVRGSPVVRMVIEGDPNYTAGSTGNGGSGSNGSGQPPRYTFEYVNQSRDTAWAIAPDQNTCCPTSSGSSSGSGQYACIFCYSRVYNCQTQTWGPAQKSGVNCQTTNGISFLTWLSPNAKVANFYILGPSCPGIEKTAGCGPFPAAPTTLPTWTPNCGSSSGSSTSFGSSAFSCVYAWTVTYDCTAKAWGPINYVGFNCQPVPSQLNQWTGTGRQRTWYVANGSCPGIEQTHGCGPAPTGPINPPTDTPPCPSGSSSGSSTSSGSSGSSGGSSTSGSSGGGSSSGGGGSSTGGSGGGGSSSGSSGSGGSTGSNGPCPTGQIDPNNPCQFVINMGPNCPPIVIPIPCGSTGSSGGSSSGSSGSSSGSTSSGSSGSSSGSTSSGSSGSSLGSSDSSGSTTPQYWATLQEFGCGGVGGGSWTGASPLGPQGPTVPINGNGMRMPVDGWGLYGSQYDVNGSKTCAYWYVQGPSLTQPAAPSPQTATPTDCGCPSTSSGSSSGSSGSSGSSDASGSSGSYIGGGSLSPQERPRFSTAPEVTGGCSACRRNRES